MWSSLVSGERADNTVLLLGKAPDTTAAGTATLRAGGESNAAKSSAPESGVRVGRQGRAVKRDVATQRTDGKQREQQ